MIETIIVPLDGSAWAEEVLPHAAAVAGACDARLLLFRVLDHSAAAGVPVDSVAWRREHKEAERYLEAHAERLRSQGLEVDCSIGEGNAAREITAESHRLQGDLIVLGSHGRGEARTFDLGSTAQQILSSGEASILLVRTGDGPPAPEGAYRRVLVPVDGSPRAECALHLAASLAREAGGEVILAHVVTIPETAVTTAADAVARRLARELADCQQVAAREYLEKTGRTIGGPGLTVRTRIEASPHVVQTLERIADEEGADLLVLSAHGGSGPAPWPYGAVPGRLLSHCGKPVLVFQDLAEGALRPPCGNHRETGVQARPRS